MDNKINLPNDVLNDIHECFKFLFDKGYKMDSATNINPGWLAWDAVLKRKDFFVKFEAEKGGVVVSFGSPSKGFMGIRPLIYFLSKEKKYVGVGFSAYSMKDEAKLLEQYINEFESLFESTFPATEEEVKLAEQKYYQRKSLWQKILGI